MLGDFLFLDARVPGTPGEGDVVRQVDVAPPGYRLRVGGSRLLIGSVLVNPAGAVRTGEILGAEGATAFGAASLAFFRP